MVRADLIRSTTPSNPRTSPAPLWPTSWERVSSIWLKRSSKGIFFPAPRNRVQLDLIYLDADCRVIDVVESFPSHNVSPSAPTASSLLGLPTLSIALSQTQPGDQVIVCDAEEMMRRIQLTTFGRGNVRGVAVTEESSGLFKKAPAVQPDGQLRQTNDLLPEEGIEDDQTPEDAEFETEAESATP